MSRTALVLNAGSSSIKFQLYQIEPDGGLVRRFKGLVDGIGSQHPRLAARDGADRVLTNEAIAPAEAADVGAAQAVLGNWLAGHMGASLDAVGHRVVHGGAEFTGPVLVDDAVLEKLEALVPLAPLHQPNNLAPMRSIRARRPELPQVACFDTAFHATLPEMARCLPLPKVLRRQGLRRYGFHGLSYEFIALRLPKVAPEIAGGRVVVAHLGSGASACAMMGGRSVETTMGFTALDGLPMGTRPGQLDPGIVLYLARQGMTPERIEHLLYHNCGLAGISGLSGDIRDLLASDRPEARLALDYFAYRTAAAFASLASAMGGLDGIVFTAGVGEYAASVREAICTRCAWMGVQIDPALNAAHAPRISAAGSRVPVHVIPTNEERMIARHTLEVLGLWRNGA